ncbi:ABC transporter permease [Nocardioides carbamazepini]|uniref:ABC transporter permease n=1 Tax=Nocardioides carbamazepini TaxID=2854259 RepID=UPI00214A576D|nr:ABC transporter permease [Nocardioides carbamazepini]MCR1785846.1 ABC transporter permease [Nocardioides carbamazepini]
MRPWLHHNGWWLRRLLLLPVHLLVFALVAFALVRTIPGDPVLVVTGNQISDDQYADVQRRLGLDGSLAHQAGEYFGRLLRLDLGDSLITGRSVTEEFGSRLPQTLELAALGLSVSLVVVLALSAVVLLRPRGVISRLAMAYARSAGAIPEFAVAVAGIFVFYASLHWLPSPLGRLGPDDPVPTPVTRFPLLDAVLTGNPQVVGSMLLHLVLPVFAMVVANSAVLLRLLCSQLEVELARPATRFRISTGAPRWVVLASIYRRALPATVTMSGTLFGYMVGGAVVLEGLFGFGGMGQYLTDAVTSADLTALQGLLVVIAAVSLVVFLLVDLINMALDPRRRPGSGGAA